MYGQTLVTGGMPRQRLKQSFAIMAVLLIGSDCVTAQESGDSTPQQTRVHGVSALEHLRANEVDKALAVLGEANRRRAALGLAEHGRLGVPLLTEAHRHDNGEVQRAAIAALETLGAGAQATVSELKRLTTDRDPRVRRAAEQAVALIEAGGAIKGILDLFKSPR